MKGEQPLPEYGACLLGSINLALFVENPFTDRASFNWDKYKEVIRVFTRMLDNVVDDNNLPLEQQREEITSKRRHGMGYLGLGSALTMLGMEYGDEESILFTSLATKTLTMEGYREGIALAKEKGQAPIFEKYYKYNGVKKQALSWWIDSEFMKSVWKEDPQMLEDVKEYGCRFTHHSSIAPTGTISLSLNNNASNGIEPSFAHFYTRNMVVEGKNTKQAVDVYSYEMLMYKGLFGIDKVPAKFSTSDTVTYKQHVDIQAAAQEWIDSSISKTINVPTDIAFDEFKDIYMYAYEKGLKGCTTFRYNAEAFQGVLVKEEDLMNTSYTFGLDDGSEVDLKGSDEVEYEGEIHTAANLFDALKEGYYGKF